MIIVDVDDTVLRYGNRPISRTIEYINSLDEEVVIITGRYSSRRKETADALRRAGLRFSRIFLRPSGDGEASSVPYKKKTAQSLKTQGKITLAIDNDQAARAAYASLGIPTKNPASLPKIV